MERPNAARDPILRLVGSAEPDVELSHDRRGESFVDIVFDAPPGPESGRFIEVEDSSGRSIEFSEWVQRDDGLWALRITPADFDPMMDGSEG